MALGIATAAHAQDTPDHGRQKIMGLNIDLFSAATGDTESDIGYLPQVWFGFGGDRLRFVDDEVVWPDGVAVAIEWFRGLGQEAFAAMADEAMFGDLDPLREGTHFAMWQRRYAYHGVVKLVAREVPPLSVMCGYSWRLSLDFGSAPWIDIVLTPRQTELIAFDASAPTPGHALMEVLWFPCAPWR
jgi:hypothetical protein